MTSLQSGRIYETEQLREVCGDTVRPGGLTLSERALAYCKFPLRAKIMDIGCGYGATVEYLLASGYTNTRGIDPSPVMLKTALQRNSSLPLLQADAESLPCNDSELEGIFCECVLSLVTDVEKVLKEFYRALGPDGLLVLSDVYDRSPCDSSGQQSLLGKCCINGAVSRQETARRLTDSGFEILLWEDHTRALKELAGQIIFTYGSLENFLGLSCNKGNDSNCKTQYTSKPGYFLAVAAKKGVLTNG